MPLGEVAYNSWGPPEMHRVGFVSTLLEEAGAIIQACVTPGPLVSQVRLGISGSSYCTDVI